VRASAGARVADLLLDTDVFVDHLRGAQRIEPAADTIHYSVITRCELFAGPDDQGEQVRLLLAPFREIPVDRTLAELAGQLRRSTGVLVPDALIAATALSRRITLVTRNLRDFEPIPKLRVREPRRARG